MRSILLGLRQGEKAVWQNVPQSPGSESSRARQKKGFGLLSGTFFLMYTTNSLREVR